MKEVRNGKTRRELSLKDRVSILEDKDAIRELRAKYAYTLDTRNIAAFLDLFTEDAIWESDRRGPFSKIAFEKYLKEMIKMAPFWVHMFMSPVIEILGETKAKGAWYMFEPQTMILKGEEKATWLCFRYDEQYTKIGDSWKFSKVKITTFFQTSFDKGWVREKIILPRITKK